MTFDEVLEQTLAMLQHRGRVSYGALKRQFELDDEYLADLKVELIEVLELAVDKDRKMLVWTGGETPEEIASQTADAPTAEPPSSLQSAHPEPKAPAGERRQLTVMFCDLVGSTALSEQLDPEDLQTVVQTYQEVSAEVIERYEGYIAQYLGDGLLVYFGYPAAHEDDAARAIHAGLEILTALHKARLRFPQPVQVRIGIHTGPVVVGEMGGGGRREQLALGETPNIAARVQGKAEPDTVVISAATQRLVAGLFEWEDQGVYDLKGISTPQPLYRVTTESEAQNRFEASVRSGLTPLVGRDDEVQLLRSRWERATQGEGQVVLVSGEPGIGKSRLVQDLKEHVTREGAIPIEFRCSPYHQNSALYPVTEHLQRLLQFAPDDGPEAKLGKLEHTLSAYRFPQADTLPLLATLLSLPHPPGAPPLTASPQKQKERTQEALVAWLVEEAERTVVYTAWEDLHWADPSTLEFLTLFLNQIPTTRLLAVLTYRPEFTPPWGTHSYISQLSLSRLGRPQVERMVERVTGGKALPDEVMQQIATKTDGVPLFVEELTKMVVESAFVRAVNSHYELTGPLPPLAIPSTLQDSLMARLDRLAPVKEVAQLGATLGREFSYALIQAVSPLDAVTLQKGLQQLVEAELVYQRGLLPQARYVFKHALIQETAYASLLKSTRQQVHQQTAQVLEERFTEVVETQPELVAHHYTEAGLMTQAIPYWQKAGERALQRSANVEATNHLTKGLELLKTLPGTPERAQQELTLQITLGPALIATKGYTVPEVEKVYARARELCQQIGETPLLFPVLWGLATFHWVRGELQTANELAEQLLRLAQSVQDPALLLQAHRVWGANLYFRGEFAPAREHLEQGIALYNPQQHHALAFSYVLDPGMHCRVYAAATLWNLGYPDQALTSVHEALTFARELSHPASLAYALNWAAIVHHLRREGQAAQEWAEEVIALSTELGFSYYLTDATNLRGWALAEQGKGEEGITQMQQGLAALRATGTELSRPYFLGSLAEAYGKKGQAEEGLNVLAEALGAVHKRGPYWWEAELYRVKGELLLHQLLAQHAEAEACFQKALEVARRQEAKSLELRAATSLARLWQQQGKQTLARELLAPVFNWFTEGFDTKDLQEAKALLGELQ